MDAIGVFVDTDKEAIEGERWRTGSKEYCAVVTLDVNNALNIANWEKISNALNRLNVPQYLAAVIRDYFRVL